jgi:hypothetical protein
MPDTVIVEMTVPGSGIGAGVFWVKTVVVVRAAWGARRHDAERLAAPGRRSRRRAGRRRRMK